MAYGREVWQRGLAERFGREIWQRGLADIWQNAVSMCNFPGGDQTPTKYHGRPQVLGYLSTSLSPT